MSGRAPEAQLVAPVDGLHAHRDTTSNDPKEARANRREAEGSQPVVPHGVLQHCAADTDHDRPNQPVGEPWRVSGGRVCSPDHPHRCLTCPADGATAHRHDAHAQRLLVSLTSGPGLARLGSSARSVALLAAAYAD
jgi:hypothetical protein